MSEEQNEVFYDDLDSARRSTGSHSCCTVWTLALLLVGMFFLGVFIIFGHR